MPQASRWCFTLNNPTTEERTYYAGLGEHPHCKYLVIGRETGEQGTPHLQGFILLDRTYRHARIRSLLPRSHVDQTRGTTKQASDYCKKDGDFDEYGTLPTNSGANSVLDPLYEWGDAFIAEHGRGPTSPEIARAHPTAYLRYPRICRLFEHRAPPPQLRSGEPRAWQAALGQELDGEPDDRSVLFYVDVDGGKGKSWFQAWYLSKYPEKVQVLSAGKRDDVAHAVDKSKSVFFFNVPRGGMEYFPYTILEQMKDRMVFSPKYNSGTKFLHKRPHVVVFCNEDPQLDRMTTDRYDIRTNYNE